VLELSLFRSGTTVSHTDDALFTRYIHGQVLVRIFARSQRLENEWTQLSM